MSYVFDAGSILILTKELGEKAVDMLKGNLTTSLAYYEVGNTLWKECSLAKRLTVNEAIEVLKFVFSLLDLMEIVPIEDEVLGVKTLSNATKLNITYYDATYLTVAQETGKILVSDDKKLLTVSKNIGVQTSLSKTFADK